MGQILLHTETVTFGIAYLMWQRAVIVSFLSKDKSESGMGIPVPAEFVDRLVLYAQGRIYCNLLFLQIM